MIDTIAVPLDMLRRAAARLDLVGFVAAVAETKRAEGLPMRDAVAVVKMARDGRATGFFRT